MSVDKNKAVINYLLQCEDIYNSPLYFNLIDAKDNTVQILTTTEDKALSKPYIDGSVLKRYTFNLITFKSISDMEIVKPVGTSIGTDEYPNENVDELDNVQDLLNWILEQDDLQNYPDFGEQCIIDKIDTTTDYPRFDGINTEITPPLAMYSISIVIEYLDISKMIYNN
jgi:hypothetical protein